MMVSNSKAQGRRSPGAQKRITISSDRASSIGETLVAAEMTVVISLFDELLARRGGAS